MTRSCCACEESAAVRLLTNQRPGAASIGKLNGSIVLAVYPFKVQSDRHGFLAMERVQGPSSLER